MSKQEEDAFLSTLGWIIKVYSVCMLHAMGDKEVWGCQCGIVPGLAACFLKGCRHFLELETMLAHFGTRNFFTPQVRFLF